MRFNVRGLWIIDSKGEFNFPIFETKYNAEQVAFVLNRLCGDSE